MSNDIWSVMLVEVLTILTSVLNETWWLVEAQRLVSSV